MKNVSIEERAINLAHYIIDTGDTVRGAAAKFGVSKSTVHTEVAKGEALIFPKIILLNRIHTNDIIPEVSMAFKC